MSIAVADSFVAVPGGKIFVRRWSSGAANTRPPILLLHDSLGCVDLWRDFPGELAQATARPVVAYDRLGFGKSTPRVERPSIDFVREEAETFFPALRDVLGFERFTLFGYSVGGAMAVMIAALRAQGCEAVITQSAQAFVEPHTLAGIRAAKERFSDSGQLGKLARWHGERARWVLEAWTEVWLSPEFSSWSLDPYLGSVRCPVLALHGDRDEYGSVEFPRRIANRVSGPSELAILDDCGHVPHRERKEDVLRLTSSFLEKYATPR